MRDLPQRPEGAQVRASGRAATIAAGWLIVGGALFAALFSHDDTDDFAGWVLAIGAAHVPAALALRGAVAGPPFRVGRALALAFPAALAFGMGVLLPSGRIAQALRPDGDGLLTILFAMIWSSVCACLVLVIFARELVQRAHPVGARRVLGVVAAAGIVSLASVPMLDAGDAGLWVLGAVALGWVLPLLAFVRSRPGSSASA